MRRRFKDCTTHRGWHSMFINIQSKLTLSFFFLHFRSTCNDIRRINFVYINSSYFNNRYNLNIKMYFSYYKLSDFIFFPSLYNFWRHVMRNQFLKRFLSFYRYLVMKTSWSVIVNKIDWRSEFEALKSMTHIQQNNNYFITPHIARTRVPLFRGIVAKQGLA